MTDLVNVYAAYSKNEELRLASSSGAMISEFADYILDNLGVIYGVAMAEDCYSAEFIRVTNKEGLSRIRGSKYLQAKVGDTFKCVKTDLDNGKNVLFTGTGCQVNGLKLYLGKEYPNLYCVDVVCHGTPSPKLWREYVEYQEAKFQSKLMYVSFRNKDKQDWDGFEMKEIDANRKEVYISRHVDPYFSLFVSNVCLRPSCYNCVAKKEKMADITVADFWGIDKVAPEMNDNKGISLVIIRSTQGEQLFDKVRNNLVIKKVTYEEGVRGNAAEYKSYDKPQNREGFFLDMNRMSFEKLYRKYLRVPFVKKCKKLVKRMLKCLKIRGHKNTDT